LLLEASGIYLARRYTQRYRAYGPQTRNSFCDVKHVVTATAKMFIAVGVVFVIFSLAEEKLGRLSVDHPHPSLRLAHLVEESAEFLVAGERYPFQDLGPIQIAAERAL
jgi:hypothetical protein